MQIVDTGSAIHVRDIPDLVERTLRQNLTLPNPAYVGAVRAGKTPIGIPKVVEFYEGDGLGTLIIPAAAERLAYAAADAHGVGITRAVNCSHALPPISLQFHGVLRLYQLAAVAEATRHQRAVIEAPTGSGKTVMGCAAIVERRQPALIIVHSQLLLDQWADAVQRFIGPEEADVSLVGAGHKWRPGASITIAIVNSLAKIAREVDPHVGHVVVDECHRAVAPGYQRALDHLTARYRLGLSATPYRRDGLGDVIRWSLGEVVTVNRSPLVSSGAVLPAEVEQRPTEFTTDIDATEHYQAVIDELVNSPTRNAQIVRDALVLAVDGLVLLLSDRREHCRALAYAINKIAAGPSIAWPLVGGQRVGERRAVAEAIASGRARVLCCTTQLVGEGFDLPAASAAMLATPIKWRGKLLQALGRVLRPAPGKSVGTLIDYADILVPVLRASARAREREYAKLAKEEVGS